MKFESKEQYLRFKAHWANYFNTEARKLERNIYGNKKKKLYLAHFIIYAILRGQDPKKCFSSIGEDTVNECRWRLNQEKMLRLPFGDTITDEQFEEARLKAKELF